MGEYITLMARDGHEFSAYLAKPPGAATGAVIIVQEIFGLNSHIRAVVDAYAQAGYLTLAPALFDRVRRSVELGYTPEEQQTGVGYMMQIKPAQFLAEVAAALAVVKHAGRVAVVGYCWGGTVAYLAACELPVACAVSYYGGGTINFLDRKPKAPVMYHFGERDSHIPPRMSRRSRWRIRKASIISTRQATALIARTALTTIPRVPRWHSLAHSASSLSTSTHGNRPHETTRSLTTQN